jgi:excisionase family DNA binding protein
MPAASVRCPACGHRLFAIDGLPDPEAPPTASSIRDPLLLRVAEAANLLGVSRSTMYQLVTSGQVQVVRIGRSVRVPRRVLEALAEAR